MVAQFKEFWGGYEWCDRQQKWFGEGSLHFYLEHSTLGVLSVSREKKIQKTEINKLLDCSSQTICGHKLI